MHETWSGGELSPAAPRLLELTLELVRRCVCAADEREVLAATAEVARQLTGAALARAILAGDDGDPSARVAGTSDVTGPIVLKSTNAASEGMTVAIPLATARAHLGTLVLSDVPPERARREVLDGVAALAELVAVALEGLRLRGELERERQAAAAERAEHDRERELLNRRLSKLHQMKDDVLAVCAHDLRSPLHVILSHTDLIADGLAGPVTDEQKQHLDAIHRQGRRMAGLIEELLHARRSGIDTLEIRVHKGDLARLLTDCVNESAFVAAEKKITLGANIALLPPVSFDEGKLRQVLVNLVANAIKFTPPGGKISIDARAEDDYVQVSVSDTGPGIPPDEADAIFERFRQGSARADGAERGIGMGLAICKEIVVRHGGEIWVESKPGQGASFRFTLPAARPQPAPGPLPPAPGTHRVLVVEDDETHAQMVALVLRERGHQVEIAHDGAEGVELARRTHPDLVLLDVQMPSVDGFTAAERLQRDARTRDIPIVFLSALEDVDLRVRGLSLGAADFLSKPFHAAELVARVERTLELADQRRRLLALANEDALTGVGNYRYLRERLRQEHARAQRYGTPLALVMLSVEDLEGINQRLGHEAGDNTLCRIGQALRDAARETDTVARYGGSDFIVLLPHARLDEARHFVERVRPAVEPLGASFGLAELKPGEDLSPEQLLRAAEAALGADRRLRRG